MKRQTVKTIKLMKEIKGGTSKWKDIPIYRWKELILCKCTHYPMHPYQNSSDVFHRNRKKNNPVIF